jgi:hypothetical protein
MHHDVGGHFHSMSTSKAHSLILTDHETTRGFPQTASIIHAPRLIQLQRLLPYLIIQCRPMCALTQKAHDQDSGHFGIDEVEMHLGIKWLPVVHLNRVLLSLLPNALKTEVSDLCYKSIMSCAISLQHRADRDLTIQFAQ